MFRWELVLEKLEFVKRIVTSDVPQALLRVADALDNLEDATRQAAEWLDSLDGRTGEFIVSGDEESGLSRLSALKVECDEELSRPRVTAGGADWRDIVLPLVVKLIEEIIRRRRPQPA